MPDQNRTRSNSLSLSK